MKIDYLLNFLEDKNVPVIEKKFHTYLSYHGFDEHYIYILKEGIVKTSVILPDGREFNFSYVIAPDIISLLKDEVSNYTSSPFNIRVESPIAQFYRLPRTDFWKYADSYKELQAYVRDYYRSKLSENLESLQAMTMNGKTGAICALLYKLINLFGKKLSNGCILIDFSITNEDIAGFCGISTRNSVNRILHKLREEDVIKIDQQKIIIIDIELLKSYIAR